MSVNHAPPIQQVVWIGGSPCAGKSTIAALLAHRYDRDEYHCDDHFDRHAEHLAAVSPSFLRIFRRSIEQRLLLDIDVQVRDEVTAYRQEFPLILNDISSMGNSRSIAEAAALLPELLFDLGVPPNLAIWLVPTEDFQRSYYQQRTWAWELLKQTSQRDVLFDRWMQRDARFGQMVRSQANTLGYRAIDVDGSSSAQEIAEDLAEWLGL